MTAQASLSRYAVSLPLDPLGFGRVMDVSRETLDRLICYAGLLQSWNRRINLVGRNTIGDLWRRHILDSAQLYPLLPPRTRVLVDLGTGAGLPGLVLAIMGVAEVHLIEADQRKAAFLREAIRVTGVNAIVHAERIERVPAFIADVVTARALADLVQLIDISEKFRNARSLCLFLKGRSAATELADAQHFWDVEAEILPSRSDPAGAILKLGTLKRSHHREPG